MGYNKLNNFRNQTFTREISQKEFCHKQEAFVPC